LNLTECGNPLPGMTCSEFGLPIGSTYGAAARCVLATDALERSKRCWVERRPAFTSGGV